MPHPIRVGIGGWSYEPWRETFYPDDVPKKGELAYASWQLTAIEINSTFYRNQKPHVFAKWADETPEDFRFTVKAQRMTTTRKTANEIREAVDWFVSGGVTALGEKLGAINWQFAKGKQFEADYFKAFLAALPAEQDGVALRHVLEVRNDSYKCEDFADLLRKHGCAVVASDSEEWPMPDMETAGFAYVRLQCSQAGEATGYPAAELDAWAGTLKDWAKTREVFAFFISGAKERNPAAARALIERVS